MRRVLISPLLLLIAATGCGGTSSTPPALQRFEALHSQLRSATSLAFTVAQEKAQLDQWISRGMPRAARYGANRLKASSRQLMAVSGSLAWNLQRIVDRDHKHAHQGYFELILAALSSEWREARTLTREADLIWANPWLSDGRILAAVVRSDRLARRWAWQAVVASHRATAWHRSHRADFRYVAVGDSHSNVTIGRFLPPPV